MAVRVREGNTEVWGAKGGWIAVTQLTEDAQVFLSEDTDSEWMHVHTRRVLPQHMLVGGPCGCWLRVSAGRSGPPAANGAPLP